ncbi:hypothetical protein AYO47_04935 [Planctomyces sp. SCGC AG-212-M04]|nr:hypothetical protein AYO47_04935 [Planctomyces sp. SCGC AG-212-M04]
MRMPGNCTIYCTNGDVSTIQSVIDGLFPGSKAKVTSAGECQVKLKGEEKSTLQLTFMRFQENGDDFCRLRLSTSVFIKGRTKGQSRFREYLCEKIQACSVAVGVVAEPDFDTDDRFPQLCYALAEALDGVMFDGTDFFNAEDEVLAEIAI